MELCCTAESDVPLTMPCYRSPRAMLRHMSLAPRPPAHSHLSGTGILPRATTTLDSGIEHRGERSPYPRRVWDAQALEKESYSFSDRRFAQHASQWQGIWDVVLALASQRDCVADSAEMAVFRFLKVAALASTYQPNLRHAHPWSTISHKQVSQRYAVSEIANVLESQLN